MFPRIGADGPTLEANIGFARDKRCVVSHLSRILSVAPATMNRDVMPNQ